ncbi:hypothetical protein LCGC14_1184070 [marine sediment metagenome]|uniref:Uncharacterized protein n=1 Tax=marine sediment metagenome TaxID=412755 RepID=A0A0F9PRS3_9ZZZZ
MMTMDEELLKILREAFEVQEQKMLAYLSVDIFAEPVNSTPDTDWDLELKKLVEEGRE